MDFLQIYELRKHLSDILQDFICLKIKSKITTQRYTNLTKDYPGLSREQIIQRFIQDYNIPLINAKVIIYEALLDTYDVTTAEVELKVKALTLLEQLKQISEVEYTDMHILLEDYIK